MDGKVARFGVVAFLVVPVQCQPWAFLEEVPSSVSCCTSTRVISLESSSQPCPQYWIIPGWVMEGRTFCSFLSQCSTPTPSPSIKVEQGCSALSGDGTRRLLFVLERLMSQS